MSQTINKLTRQSPTAEKISATAKVRRLLESPPPAQAQREWTGFYAAEKTVAPPVVHSVVIFRLGQEWLAMATSVFQEIAEWSVIHSLPHRRKDTLLGLVRVRGELLICVSLAALLGVTKEQDIGEPNQLLRFIVLAHGADRFVFPADEVFGVYRVTGELLPVPATVAQAASTYTRGVFQWKGHTVGCLDDQLLFHTLNRSLA